MICSFLALPLLLLSVFTYYSIFLGIYISFMRYEILRKPVLGSPITFITHFVANLDNIEHPFFSVPLLIIAILVGFVTIKKKVVSRKLISLLFLCLLIINLIPLSNIINITLQEINYVIFEEKTVANANIESVSQVFAYSGNIRTLFPELSGQHSGNIRTPCRIIK